MIRLFVSTVAALACVSVPAAAQDVAERPEAVLFDGVGYTGAPQPVFSEHGSLRAMGFNNRASSIDIRAGQWQVCTDARFEGRCEMLSAGVTDLTVMGLNNAISSIRPISNTAQMDINEPLILHSRSDFDGNSVSVTESIANLSDIDFNNKTRSVTVNDGIWELCADRDYGGRCTVVTASMDQLREVKLNKKISSVRRTNQTRPPEDYQIALFSAPNYAGNFKGLDGEDANLFAARFDNEARSVQINSGRWVLCEDRNFMGQCEVVNQSIRDLDELGLEGKISSVRPYLADADSSVLAGGPDRIATGYGGLHYPGEETVFFPAPEVEGVRVDECTNDNRRDCGQPAASDFCRRAGLTGVAFFAIRSGLETTVDARGKALCTDNACRALSDVVCTK